VADSIEFAAYQGDAKKADAMSNRNPESGFRCGGDLAPEDFRGALRFRVRDRGTGILPSIARQLAGSLAPLRNLVNEFRHQWVLPPHS
jgi:hypothetical protein